VVSRDSDGGDNKMNGQRNRYSYYGQPQGYGAYNPWMKHPDIGGFARGFVENWRMMKQAQQQQEQREWQRNMQERDIDVRERQQKMREYKEMFPEEKEVKKTPLDYKIEYADFMQANYPEEWTPERVSRYKAEGKEKKEETPEERTERIKADTRARQEVMAEFKTPKDTEEIYTKAENAIRSKYNQKRLSVFTKFQSEQTDALALLLKDRLGVDIEAKRKTILKTIMDEINKYEQQELYNNDMKFGKGPPEGQIPQGAQFVRYDEQGNMVFRFPDGTERVWKPSKK
jgi:hypothetical protein